MKRFFLLVAVFMLAKAGFSQDFHFSMFNENPLNINPALTGAFPGDHRMIVNYKNQWQSISDPFRTYSGSYDAGLFKKEAESGYLSAGLQFLNDEAGTSEFKTFKLDFAIAYHVVLGYSSTLSAGISGGFCQRSMNNAALYWDNQYDGTGGFDQTVSSGETSTFEDFSYGDFSAGLMYSYATEETSMASNDGIKFNLGGAAYHLNQPKLTFGNIDTEKLFAKYIVHARGQFGIFSSNTAIVAQGMFANQGPTREIVAGMGLRFMLTEQSHYTGFMKESALTIGASYRVGDAIIPQLMLEISNFAIGIGYDVNTSGLNVASDSKGGTEIFLRYINPSPFRYQNKSFNKSFF
ncbi:MAG: PorP/SprF family type IX secretion system membrane protein [Bacteroidales bacterium]|nr:PorP/SprF family type IX secretion system membrane protein [Bacteroidales bacterium]